MTGTAQTEAAELHQIYKLGVVSIPTNRPMVRDDQPDLIYKTEEAKFEAVADDIAEKHAKGQPVLVGTTSVEKSEYLAKLLVQLPGAARGAQRQAARARGRDHRPGRARGRGHRRHQHGRPRHRHRARRQPRVPGRPGAAQPRPRPGRDPRGVRGGLGRGRRARCASQVAAEAEEVKAGRRALRAGHRAPRVAAHRQPAARPLRPPGRPGRVAVLPLARRRPHAPVQRPASSSRS